MASEQGGDAPEHDTDLPKSALGTHQFWDHSYRSDLDTYNEAGDTGQAWFGSAAEQRILAWLNANGHSHGVEHRSSILDAGCGNGTLLQRLLQEGYRNLVGIDYSEAAIGLARRVISDRFTYAIGNEVALYRADLSEDLSDSAWSATRYALINDKGTYDAISLAPDDAIGKRRRYLRNIAALLRPNGLFFITTCNWTRSEMLSHCRSLFDFLDEVAVKSIEFGGRSGQATTVLVFRKGKLA